ncbi:MAG: tail fiber domain-containing protein [Bacteroidetes bacterium]|nr:tail fiber domain-containing protein [Bacteroidota bacterium]
MAATIIHRIGRALGLLVVSVAILACPVRAQQLPPRLLSYQGVLADNKRTAVPDGSYTVTFRIYDVASGGTAIWQETDGVQTVDGVFEAILGEKTPMVLPFDKSYWIGLELQGEPEMTPRVRFVATPYSMHSIAADSALLLDRGAPGVVHTLNTLDGNLVLVGEGGASVRTSGDTLAIVVPAVLPTTAADGQTIRWNATSGKWEAVDASIATKARIAGNGSAAAPLDIARMGATNGQALVWNDAAGAWQPGASGVQAQAPLRGDGSSATPLGLVDGTADRQVLLWDATARAWKAAEPRVVSAQEVSGTGTTADPLRLAAQGAADGQVLRWDATARGWRPGPSITTANPPLKGTGSPGDPLMLADGSVQGALLFWDGTRWKATTARAPVHGELLRWNANTKTWEPAGIAVNDNGDMSLGGNLTIGGNLLVGGVSVSLPNGSVDNNELANSKIKLAYSTGISGDDTVALGGTLRLFNTGVTQIKGTPNQVIADTGRGVVTLSLPQNIDTNASPKFNGLTLNGSLIVKGSSVTLPNGSVDNSELAHSTIKVAYGAGIAGDDSVALGSTLNVRNTGVLTLTGTANQVNVDTARGNVTLSLPSVLQVDTLSVKGLRSTGNATIGGNLTVNGTTVTLPNGSVDNNELANSAIRVVYGSGIAGDTTVSLGGSLNVRNTGVLSLSGTTNQVRVDTARGNVTLSLPQDIHRNAQPQFDGLTLNALVTGTSDTLLIANGGVVQRRMVSSLVPSLGNQWWTLTGNSGSTPGTNFVGTTDDQALQFHVGNGVSSGTDGRGRVMRFEPNGTSANIIGGYAGNTVAAGTVGATIAGGGLNGSVNSVSSNYGTISGGSKNSIGTTSTISVIGGGNNNSIAASSGTSVIAGGSNNAVNSATSVIGGGNNNSIGTTSTVSVIAGGNGNSIAASSGTSVVSGGGSNSIATGSTTSVIGGGSGNSIAASSGSSTIGGGTNNSTGSNTSVIGGGDGNAIGTNARWTKISGGHNNKIIDNAYESSIGAGEGNNIGNGSVRGTVGGGSFNIIEASASNSTIAGGYGNNLRFSADRSTIGGGMSDVIDTGASISVIGGGFQNVINKSSNTSTISGGSNNAIGSTNSTVSGGTSNTISTSSSNSTVSGGSTNSIGSSSGNATISGGQSNAISTSSGNATISGGTSNTVSASLGTISGGTSNTVSASLGTVSGGQSNVVSGARSTIAGGRGLTLSGTGSFGFLGANTGTNDMQVATNNVAVLGNTALWLANNNNTASQARFYEPYATAGAFPSTANYSSFQAQAQTADINYVLPDTAGIAGDVLKVKTVAGTTVTLDWATDNTGSTAWGLTGNAGTTPGTNFVGTTDDQAIEFHVGDGVSSGTDGRGRVMRFEPNATSANIIGGYRTNSAAAGVVCATISGGGTNGGANSISSNYGTIGGGNRNTIAASSINSTIAGGVSNSVGSSTGNGTIGGGLGNAITSGDHTTIAGGFNNKINTGSFGCTISGGTNNSLSSHTSVVSGGNGNVLGTSSQFSVIGGGSNNNIGNSSFESLIGGGTVDTIEASAPYSTIGGGTTNAIRTSATKSTIGGGYDNEIGTGSDRATIGGGEQNKINAGAYRTTIGGGMQNVIDVGGRWSTIGGGEQNYSNALSSTLAGGTHDTIETNAQNSFIGGGDMNAVRSAAQYAIITGGRNNQISSNASYAAIGGGQYNVVGAQYSAIAGGRGLTLSGSGSFGFLGANTGANDMSISTNNVAVLGNTNLWLANNNNTASQIRFYEPNATTGAFPGTAHYTAFVAQAQGADIAYTLPAAAGGVGDQLTISAIAGTQVTLGWAAPSDRRIKSDIITIDGESVLGKFRDVSLGSWRYTTDPSGHRHYGIMAQDFHRLFGNDGVGVIGTDTTVNNLDMMGVSYLAIQALEKRTASDHDAIEDLKSAVQTLRDEVEALRRENRELRQRVQ